MEEGALFLEGDGFRCDFVGFLLGGGLYGSFEVTQDRAVQGLELLGTQLIEAGSVKLLQTHNRGHAGEGIVGKSGGRGDQKCEQESFHSGIV